MKWIASSSVARGTGLLSAGDSQKLVGRLTWAQTHMFHRVGRAMLRPIFEQSWTRIGRFSKVLRAALLWWLNVLDMGICEPRQLFDSDKPPICVFLDTRGEPPRCAAVAFIDGVCHHNAGKPSERLWRDFSAENMHRRRRVRHSRICWVAFFWLGGWRRV